MNKTLRGLSSSCLVSLLVLTAACAKASFAPTSGDVGATGGTAETEDSGLAPEVGGSDVAGSDVGESDVGGSCSEPNLPCAGVPTTGICDPVCQLRGCDWCTEKCSYVFDGTNTRPACVSHKGQAAFPDSCVLSSSDLSQQSDDCAPGNICLPPTVGDSIQYCFQLCSIDADCLGGVACGPFADTVDRLPRDEQVAEQDQEGLDRRELDAAIFRRQRRAEKVFQSHAAEEMIENGQRAHRGRTQHVSLGAGKRRCRRLGRRMCRLVRVRRLGGHGLGFLPGCTRTACRFRLAVAQCDRNMAKTKQFVTRRKCPVRARIKSLRGAYRYLR